MFDPVGWISPVLIKTKVLLQHLWLEGTDWDECVKPLSFQSWKDFVERLPQVEEIQVPRWIHYSPNHKIELHEFCDVFEKAYCATLYIRSEDKANVVSTHIFISKTKVAPLHTISLPGLQLCGAILLSKLIKAITPQLHRSTCQIFLWSDPAIVLAWLEKPPYTWKTYVANRTSTILLNI